jgi:type VI protein secretion system component VasK
MSTRQEPRLLRRAPRPNLVERRMNKFLRGPPSVRAAASVIVTATATVVVVGGIAIRFFDHTEYANVWVGMWWALQTVTTVGYGDVTPAKVSGRLIASFVMLEGIAFVVITTAAVTSVFVARAQEQRRAAHAAESEEIYRLEHLEAQTTELTRRFDEFEQLLRQLADGGAPKADP